MTYEYQDLVTGEIFEVQQSIKDPPFTHRVGDVLSRVAEEHEAKPLDVANLEEWVSSKHVPHPVKRLISADSGGFRLVSGESGGWASSGYGHKPHELDAMRTLGRKLVKPAS